MMVVRIELGITLTSYSMALFLFFQHTQNRRILKISRFGIRRIAEVDSKNNLYLY